MGLCLGMLANPVFTESTGFEKKPVIHRHTMEPFRVSIESTLEKSGPGAGIESAHFWFINVVVVGYLVKDTVSLFIGFSMSAKRERQSRL
jgi:hypothetical protein